jgi:hypothetical protein
MSWLLALIPAGLKKAALYALGGALIIAAAFLWLHVHDANVRSTALTGYVQQAELVAANARTNEIRRQASAAQAALDEYQRKLAAEQANNAQAQAALEAEIEAYEKNITDSGRACRVDDADRDWLLGNTK